VTLGGFKRLRLDAQARWPFLGVLLPSLTVGAGLRIWLSLHDDGIYWPDEIYQSLEPAHRLVFGYGMIAWEFIEGARNWALPGLVALVLKLSSWSGVTRPDAYLLVVRFFFSIVSLATAWGAFRLARALGATSLAASCSAALFALAAPSIYFAHRAMSENASALAVVWGLALSLPPTVKPRRRWLGASVLGAATLIRVQSGIFCFGLLGILLARRQWRACAQTGLILLAWALLYGALDKVTWGGWFHSAIVYLRFNLLEGQASQWGVSTAGFYLRTLFTSMPPVAVALAVLVPLGAVRARGLFLVLLAYGILHSLIPHKELRFLLPEFPLLCALAGIGLSWVAAAFSRAASNALSFAALACAATSAARFHALTFGDLGQYESIKPSASAYDDFGPVNRLLRAAYGVPDLCGLKVEPVHLAWTGGYSYLHRDVPLYPHSGPPRQSRFFNYAIALAGASPGDEVVRSEWPFVLVRIFPGSCAPDPGFSWRLP